MPKKIMIKTSDENGNYEEIAELEFTDSEWETLQDFAKYAGELEDNSLIKEGIPASLNLTLNMGEGLKVTTKLPTDEQIDAMLMKLRPFILGKEPTSFSTVRGILRKATKGDRVKKHLDTLYYLFSGERLQSQIVVGASSPEHPEGMIINSETLLDHWLNGYRFHKDKERRKIVDLMHGIMPLKSSIVLFLLLITDKVAAILGLQRIVQLMTGERDKIFAEIQTDEPLRYIGYIQPTIVSLSFFEHSPEEEREFPPPGPWERVFDLTELGPANVPAFLNLFGRLWMKHELREEIGRQFYYFRLNKGFRTPDKEVSDVETDIIVTLQVQVLLMEDPFSWDRRKPVKAMLERMRAEREGKTSTEVLLKSFDTKEELDNYLNRDPKPELELVIVPRVAFRVSYWPVSREAGERLHKIVTEGREPTFQAVEGSNITRVWEIFA